MVVFKFQFSILPTPIGVSFALHRGETSFVVNTFGKRLKAESFSICVSIFHLSYCI